MTDLILALIELLDYFDVQIIESYLTKSFSKAEILEKQSGFEFSKISRKVAWLPWQHSCDRNGGTKLFGIENHRKKSPKHKLVAQSRFEDML